MLLQLPLPRPLRRPKGAVAANAAVCFLLTAARAPCAQEEVQPAFVKYIRDNWERKLELWVKGALAGLNHRNIFTNAHIEAYHGVLKEFHLRGKRLSRRRLCRFVSDLQTVIIGQYTCAHGAQTRAPSRTVKADIACGVQLHVWGAEPRRWAGNSLQVAKEYAVACA